MLSITIEINEEIFVKDDTFLFNFFCNNEFQILFNSTFYSKYFYVFILCCYIENGTYL